MNARPSRRSHRRWIARLALIVTATAAVVLTRLWWDDRLLYQASQAWNRHALAQAYRLTDAHLREHPDDGRALGLLGQIFAAQARWAEAAAAFDRAGAETVPARRAWAEALLHERRFSDALVQLDHILAQAPDDATALQEAIACHNQLGQYDVALARAETLRRLDGFADRGWLIIGTIQSESGNRSQALDAWNELLQLNPDARGLPVRPDEFFLELGRVQLADAQPDAAVVSLTRSLSLHDSAAAGELLGEAHESGGETMLADDAWRAVVAKHPQSRVAREGLARLALARGDAASALTWLEPLADAPDLRRATAYLLERAYLLSGNAPQATLWRLRTEKLRALESHTRLVEDLLNRNPRSFWSRVVRAHRFASRGDWQQAAELVSQLTAENANEPFVRDLAAAIARRGPLPDLQQLPVQQY